MGSSERRRGHSATGDNGAQFRRRDVLALAALGTIASHTGAANAAAPVGQLVYGVHISLAPTWFDPA
jgi:peptide/nickel transport system substrate-binding protein